MLFCDGVKSNETAMQIRVIVDTDPFVAGNARYWCPIKGSANLLADIKKHTFPATNGLQIEANDKLSVIGTEGNVRFKCGVHLYYSRSWMYTFHRNVLLYDYSRDDSTTPDNLFRIPTRQSTHAYTGSQMPECLLRRQQYFRDDATKHLLR